MENIKTSLKGNTLTVTIDLSQRLRPSSSGKNLIVATTGGNQGIGDGSVKMGINLFTNNPDYVPTPK